MSKPKFQVGDIVQYTSYSGKTGISSMVITSISYNHGSYGAHRYYGKTYYGNNLGAYEGQLVKLSSDEAIISFKYDNINNRLNNIFNKDVLNLCGRDDKLSKFLFKKSVNQLVREYNVYK